MFVVEVVVNWFFDDCVCSYGEKKNEEVYLCFCSWELEFFDEIKCVVVCEVVEINVF